MSATPTTIIYQFSNDQLVELAAEIVNKISTNEATSINQAESPPGQVVYGIGGIARLFGVSKSTAQHYKNTFLAPAVTQRGRKIVTDVALAMELFNQYNKE